MANSLPSAPTSSGISSTDVNNAATQGQSAISGFDPTTTASNLNTTFNNLAGSQLGSGPQNAGDYLSAYSKQVAANPTVTSLYNTANQNFNVQPLAQQATYLQNQVNQATPNAYAQAKGFDVSDPQVQNQINTSLRFLQPEANAATANAQTAQTLAGQQVAAGQLQNTQNLLPIQSYQSTMNQALAAQATGWTQDAQNQMAGLQAKMQSGATLSAAEMTAYASLQTAQEAYNSALTTAVGVVQQAAVNQQYQPIGANGSLVNTQNNGIVGQYAPPK